jgi:hypothetical protein
MFIVKRLEQLKLCSFVLKKLHETALSSSSFAPYSTKTTQSNSSNGKKYASEAFPSHNESNTARSSIELSVKESKRIMRLVYARVHPDLFTNHLKAQVSLTLTNHSKKL